MTTPNYVDRFSFLGDRPEGLEPKDMMRKLFEQVAYESTALGLTPTDVLLELSGALESIKYAETRERIEIDRKLASILVDPLNWVREFVDLPNGLEAAAEQLKQLQARHKELRALGA